MKLNDILAESEAIGSTPMVLKSKDVKVTIVKGAASEWRGILELYNVISGSVLVTGYVDNSYKDYHGEHDRYYEEDVDLTITGGEIEVLADESDDEWELSGYIETDMFEVEITPRAPDAFSPYDVKNGVKNLTSDNYATVTEALQDLPVFIKWSCDEVSKGYDWEDYFASSGY